MQPKRLLYVLLAIIGLCSTYSRLYAQVGPLPCGAVSSITTWRNDFPYVIGQVVIFDGVTYQSLTNNNLNQNPCTYSGSQWTNVVGTGGGGGGAPTGPAGGVLGGTYPNPSLASSGAIPNGWTATTQSTGDSSSAIATDAFVIANQSVSSVLSVFGRTGNVSAANGDYTVSQVTGAAPLNSPGLTGVPTAPTATVGTNTVQLATTAFVIANAGGGGSLPSGNMGQPLVNTSGSSTYATSQIFYDASQFSGGIAEKVNACVTAAIAVAGTCDARALGAKIVSGKGIAAAVTTDTQINVGNSSGDPVTLLLPASFYWVGGMTDGTSCTLAQFPNTAIIGQGTPNGSAGVFGASNTSSLGYVYCTKPITGASAPDYYYDFGFSIWNYSNGDQYKGHVTANGIGSFINGPAYDESRWESMNFFDPLDTYDVYVSNVCCNTTFRNSEFNGNYGSIPLFVTGSSAVSFDHSNFVHPGAGVPAFSCAGGSVVSVDDAYTETNNSNTSETIYNDNGCSRLTLSNITIKAYASGMSAPGITVANSASQVVIDGMSMLNGSGDFFLPATAVVNNFTGQTVQTDAIGNLPRYDSAQTGAGGTVHAVSPTLTGTPLSTTKPISDNNTEIATTGAVNSALGSYAPINSPAFTGVPTAPTAAAGTSTTQLATTQFGFQNFLVQGGNYNSTQFTQTPIFTPGVGTIWQADGFPASGGTFAGTWNSSTTYARFQTVNSGGQTWIALNGSVNVSPAVGADGAAQFWAPCTASATSVAATQADAAFYWAWEQVQVHATGFGANSSVGLVFGDRTGGYNKNCDWKMPTNAFGYSISIFGQGRGQTWIHQTTSTLTYMIDSPNVNSSAGQTIQGITLDANIMAGGCLSHHLRRSLVTDIACWNPQEQPSGSVHTAMWLGSGADAYETKYEHLLVRSPTYNGLTPAYGTATVTAGAITSITWTSTGAALLGPSLSGAPLVTYITGKGATSTSYKPCTTMPTVTGYDLTGPSNGINSSGTGVNGLTFGSAGVGCGGTIYIRVQAGPTLNEAFYLNGSDSTIDDIVSSGDFAVACEFVNGPNILTHEHPYCAAPYQIESFGGGQRTHLAPEMDSPVQYGMYIGGTGATVIGGFTEYNASGTEAGVGDYLIDASATNFTVAGSGCYSGSSQTSGGYAKYTGTTQGPLTINSTFPASASISGVQENCDGTATLWGQYLGGTVPTQLTTSGSSGAATLANGVLNIPQYSAPSPVLPSLYSTSVTYAAGALAYDGSGNNYISLAGTNLNNALTNVTWWHFMGGVSATITGGNCVTTGQYLNGISTAGVPNCSAVGYLNGAAIPVSTALVGTNSSGQLVAGTALVPSNNLSDVASVPTSRANLSDPLFATQISIGDSITWGFEASSPDSGYPYWISHSANIPNYINDGYVGYFSGQMDTVIFAQAFAYKPTTLINYTIGTNNVNVESTDTNQLQNYLLNIEAQMAWWSLPSSQKTLFSTGSVTYTGTWINESINNVGKTTSSNGATATFTGTGTILYLVTEMTTSGGAASLTCDGTATGATLLFAGSGPSVVPVNQTALTRVSGLASGSHSCVVTVTSSSGNVILEWAGFTTNATKTSAPYVLIGGVPTQNTSNATVISAVNSYRSNQSAAVTLFNGDGFSHLGYVDTSAVGGPSNAKYYNDQYHFTDYGYYLFAAPFVSELNTLASTSYVEGNFINRPAANFGPQGGNSLCLMANSCNSSVLGQASTNFAGVRVEAFGVGAAGLLTTATDTVAIGFNSLASVTTGVQNVGIGSQSLQNLTGARNTGVGSFALFAATGGSNDDTGVGDAACQNGSGTFTGTTCIGSQAGFSNTGGNNIFVGFNAGTSGTAVTTDSSLTIVGATAGKGSASIFTNSTALGFQASISASNQMVFGNSSVTTNVFHGALSASSISVATGRKGTFVCTVGGTITISNTNELTTSDVVISLNTAGGAVSTPPAMKTVTSGTGFTVLCGAADTSTYNYDILN